MAAKEGPALAGADFPAIFFPVFVIVEVAMCLPLPALFTRGTCHAIALVLLVEAERFAGILISKVVNVLPAKVP